MVKLNYRWQDTIYNFQERMNHLKQIQSEQRNIAKQRALAARTSIMNRSDKFSLLFGNMRGKVGQLSSIAISKGKKNFISHYNAKKRVYARRKVARQLARTLMLEKWKSRSRYYLSRENRWGWMGAAGNNNSLLSSNDSGDNTTATWKGVTLTEPSDPTWFDKDGYPLTSRDPETGRFVNPWLSESSNGKNGLKKFFRWKVVGGFNRLMEAVGLSSGNETETSTKEKADYYSADTNLTSSPVPHSDSELGQSLHRHAIPQLLRSSGEINHTIPSGDQNHESIKLTWVGHSSTVVTFPGGFTILTDPHFSNYAGPVRRATPPAIGVADLPEVVDCVLISHDHMDHLDYWSILELIDSNKVGYWIVPLGIKSWLIDKAGVSPESIVELEWWEEVHLSKPIGGKLWNDDTTEKNVSVVDKVVGTSGKVTFQRDNVEEEKSISLADKNQLVITCAPAQHWCSRSPFDRNKRLWCSFSVHATPGQSDQSASARTHSFYFAGDTGLPHEFPLHHQIGDRLGPFDLSAIPIGAYEPNWFMREAHCNPAEAVKIHQALRSRRSVAIHFDTFNLADEPMEEPPNLLLAEVRRVNEEITKVAANVAAVVDKTDVATAQLGIDTTTANKNLIEMFPSLVDFAVIKQGQSIESVPNDVNGVVGSRVARA
ncbi:hypothetical protein ACHAWU_006432 [Discostella pseudostelligera]|uniref:Metallo-beta-lactamase domain-containing protein n=1 Tax=Discostella pseudostelligera TaxID=259834 RepID=A0ABD3N4Q5_9STRA